MLVDHQQRLVPMEAHASDVQSAESASRTTPVSQGNKRTSRSTWTVEVAWELGRDSSSLSDSADRHASGLGLLTTRRTAV
jgi:hypothetical protein